MTTIYVVIAGLVLFAPKSDFSEMQIFLVKDTDHVAEICYDARFRRCLQHHPQRDREALSGQEISITVNGAGPTAPNPPVAENFPGSRRMASSGNSTRFGWIAQLGRFDTANPDCGKIHPNHLRDSLGSGFAGRLKTTVGNLQTCLLTRKGRTVKRAEFKVPDVAPEDDLWHFTDVVVLRLDFDGNPERVFINLDGEPTVQLKGFRDCGENRERKCGFFFLSNLSNPNPRCQRQPAEAHNFKRYYEFAKASCQKKVPVAVQPFGGKDPQPNCHPRSGDSELEALLEHLKITPPRCSRSLFDLFGVQNRPVCLMATLFQ